MSRIFKMGLLLTVAVSLLVSGCSELENKGAPPANEPPQINFANIPIDGTEFSVNPTLFWYGTDKDGTVEKYEYAVLRHDVVARYLQDAGWDTNSLPASFPEMFISEASDPDYDWTVIWVDSVQTATRGEVRLYASFDTNIVELLDIDTTCAEPPCTTVSYLIDCDIDSVGYEVVGEDTVAIYDTLNCISQSIQQYMFIRATDDNEAVSEIKYRQYRRGNHWPQTKIEDVPSFTGATFINQALPTQTYEGIPIAWSGSDSSDYPRNQPDFEYWWRVFGPFETFADADTLADHFIYDSSDSLFVETGNWVKRPDGEWVYGKGASLLDLWRKVAASDETRTGYFLFDIRTRDDAFAADPTPARVVFRVIDPKFERRLLFIDDAFYGQAVFPLTPMGSGLDRTSHPELLRNRIFDILRAATDGAIDLDENSQDYYRRVNDQPVPQMFVPIDLLARYSLVLLVDDDDVNSIPAFVERELKRYLDVGGKVWVFGRGSFIGDGKSPRDFDEPSIYPAGQTARRYFDADGIYLPAWWRESLDDQSPQQFVIGNDDFVGALPDPDIFSEGPELWVDTSLSKDYSIPYSIRRLYGIGEFVFETIPEANYIERGLAAEPLYTYISRYAGTALAHKKVCAIRYIGPNDFNPVFKTAWFSFSPYAIGDEGIVPLFRIMIDWFEEDF